MKYQFARKINLANIDKDLWGFETEDFCISEADSFEEAMQQVDKMVVERIAYYKAKADVAREARLKTATPPADTPSTGKPAPQAPPSTAGSGPPKEFEVD